MTTGTICWHDRGTFEDDAWHRDVCPARNGALAYYGRCRSGRRWFWVTQVGVGATQQCAEQYGRADTEAEATAAAKAAVVHLAAGHPTIAYAMHGLASNRLKEVNAAKRAARPYQGDGGTGIREYLYWREYFDGEERHGVFLITKKTSKRVYFTDGFGRNGYVDRAKLETQGYAYTSGFFQTLHLHPQKTYAERYAEGRAPVDADLPGEVARLRRRAADAHPDRGGTNEGFRAAHGAYMAAKKRLDATSTQCSARSTR